MDWLSMLMGCCEIDVNYIIEAETKRRHFVDDIFECIFLNENIKIAIKI